MKGGELLKNPWIITLTGLLVVVTLVAIYNSWNQATLDAKRVTFQMRKLYLVLHNANAAVSTAIDDPSSFNLQQVVRRWAQMEEIADILNHELQLQGENVRSLDYFSFFRSSLSYPHIFNHAESGVKVADEDVRATLACMKANLDEFCEAFPADFVSLFDYERECRKVTIDRLKKLVDDLSLPD